MKKDKFAFLILHNIRSAHNVGSLFRTADAVGVSKLFLTGYTPAPIDRFGRPRKDISKVALGAEQTVLWEHVKNISTLIKRLKNGHVHIIALEQARGAVDYRKLKVGKHFALVLGNEVTGISKTILDQCDMVAQIPMRGKKESLNVAVAGGIALFQLFGV